MKILQAKINGMLDFDNNPRLYILVDKIPEYSSLIYEEKNGIYYAEKDGYVDFKFYSEPDRGYGGRIFTFKMKDGSIRKLIGPWSSNSNSVNKYFGPCVECAITDDPKVWEKGYTFYSSAITLDLFKEGVKMANANVGKSEYDIYTPMPKCNCGKPSQKFRKWNNNRTERKLLCEYCAKEQDFSEISGLITY